MSFSQNVCFASFKLEINYSFNTSTATLPHITQLIESNATLKLKLPTAFTPRGINVIRITAKRIKWKFQDSYFAKLNHKRQEWQVEIQARLLWNLGESRQVYFNLIHNSDRDTTRSHVHRIEWVPSMFKFGHVDEVCEFKVQQTW